MVLWRDQAVAALTGDRPFSPTVRLLGEMGAGPLRERAARRLEAFLAAEAGRRLPVLRCLLEVMAAGEVKGLARGLIYRLIEAAGVIDRRAVEIEVHNLSQAERRHLRSLGVRIGAFSLYLPNQLTPQARAFTAGFALQASPVRALGWRGRLTVGSGSQTVEALEQLDEQLRGAEKRGGGMIVSATMQAALAWPADETPEVLRALGYAPAQRDSKGGVLAWRRRRAPGPAKPTAPPIASPFAALSVLQPAPASRHGRRRKRFAARA